MNLRFLISMSRFRQIHLGLLALFMALPYAAHCDTYQEIFSELADIQKPINDLQGSLRTALAGVSLAPTTPNAGRTELWTVITPHLTGGVNDNNVARLDAVDARIRTLSSVVGDADLADQVQRVSAIAREKNNVNRNIVSLVAKALTLEEQVKPPGTVQAIESANAHPWLIESLFLKREDFFNFDVNRSPGNITVNLRGHFRSWLDTLTTAYAEKTRNQRRTVLESSPDYFQASYTAVKRLFNNKAWVVRKGDGTFSFIDQWGNPIEDRYLKGRMIIAGLLDPASTSSQPFPTPDGIRYNIQSSSTPRILLNPVIQGVYNLAAGAGLPVPEIAKLNLIKTGTTGWSVSHAGKLLGSVASADGKITRAAAAPTAAVTAPALSEESIAVEPASGRLLIVLPPAVKTTLGNRTDEHPWHKPKLAYKWTPVLKGPPLVSLQKNPETATKAVMEKSIPAGKPKVDNHYLWILTDDLTFYYAPKFQLNHNPNRQEIKHRDLAVPSSEAGGATVVWPARMGGEFWFDAALNRWVIDNDSSYCFPNVREDGNFDALRSEHLTRHVKELLVEYGFFSEADIAQSKVSLRPKTN